MKSKKWMMTGLLALVLASSGASWASPSAGFGPGEDSPADVLLQKLAGLNLTSEQKTAIAGILKENRKDVQTAVKYFRAARENQFKAIHEEVFDEQAVREACRVTARYEEELAVVRARMVSDIKQVLTPEQKEQLSDLRLEVKDRLTTRLETARSILDSWIEANSAK